MTMRARDEDQTRWPELPLEAWQDTLATLHRMAQIVGKVRLALTPQVNHFWNAAFALTPRGFTTGPTPAGDLRFSIDFDFIDHLVAVRTSDGARRALPLAARPVADFLAELFLVLSQLGVEVEIDDRPVEIPSEAIPMRLDHEHASYEPLWAARCFEVIAASAMILEELRAGFVGKQSPVHFFWGSFDLAYTRFSGRRAPERPGADRITREAYSHECFSVGFWPGDARYSRAAYYAYMAPTPAGYERARVLPAAAFWHPDLNEFVLPYDSLRSAADPRAMLLDFAQSAYAAGADLAGWDRAALERQPPIEERPAAEAPPYVEE